MSMINPISWLNSSLQKTICHFELYIPSKEAFLSLRGQRGHSHLGSQNEKHNTVKPQ